MKNNRKALWIGVLILLIVSVFLLRNRIHFDWKTFGTQLRLANWTLFGVGILLIYLGYCLRAVRWALLMKSNKAVPPFSLLGSQIIGFTAVALFGRVADLVRPYLTSRRTQVALSTQVGVYAVERIFDLGTNALIFALILLFAPDRNTLPAPERVRSFAFLALAAVIGFACFAVAVRVAGHKVARVAGRWAAAISPSFSVSVEEKILAFREGLTAINSFSSFVQAAGLSLAMWMMIVYAYLETVHAFNASPPLAHMTLSRVMLLMAASQGASLVQLPVIGWFTQIGIVAKAIQSFFGAASEPSVAAAAMLLIVTFMSVIPAGLIWSRFEHVSLKKLTEESEHATEEMAQSPVVDPNAA